MPLFNWPAVTETRGAVITLPLLSLGSREQVITWATPMPEEEYAVQFAFQLGAANVGGVSAAVKPGTMTATGLTVNLNNTLLVSISAGSKLFVTATQLSE